MEIESIVFWCFVGAITVVGILYVLLSDKDTNKKAVAWVCGVIGVILAIYVVAWLIDRDGNFGAIGMSRIIFLIVYSVFCIAVLLIRYLIKRWKK